MRRNPFRSVLRTKWAALEALEALEALVGDPKRIALPLRVAGGEGVRPVRTGKCG